MQDRTCRSWAERWKSRREDGKDGKSTYLEYHCSVVMPWTWGFRSSRRSDRFSCIGRFSTIVMNVVESSDPGIDGETKFMTRGQCHLASLPGI